MPYSLSFVRFGSSVSYDSTQYEPAASVHCPKNCGATYTCLISRASPPSQHELIHKREVARTTIGTDCPFHEKRDELLL